MITPEFAKSSDEYGRTPLHFAVTNRNLEQARYFLFLLFLLRMLLTCGASVNACDRYGSTPLSLASVSAQAEMVALLLEYGADGFLVCFLLFLVTVKDVQGMTPLQYARSRLKVIKRYASSNKAKAIVFLNCSYLQNDATIIINAILAKLEGLNLANNEQNAVLHDNVKRMQAQIESQNENVDMEDEHEDETVLDMVDELSNLMESFSL